MIGVTEEALTIEPVTQQDIDRMKEENRALRWLNKTVDLLYPRKGKVRTDMN